MSGQPDWLGASGRENPVRVLIVEDDERLRRHLVRGLEQAGMVVDAAGDGAEALAKESTGAYDVVVLDRDLPVVHGDEVCAAVAARGQSRILMLTAASAVGDRIEGLSLGADDYLGKPFAFAELVLRIRSLGRRGAPAPRALVDDDIRLDPHRREVWRGDELVGLTSKEFAVLEHLLRADGGVVSTEELFARVWDDHVDPMSNVVAVTVGRLRRRLGDPDPITTIIGSGYRL
jgi:DNA-binding response OmpR family regulator